MTLRIRRWILVKEICLGDSEILKINVLNQLVSQSGKYIQLIKKKVSDKFHIYFIVR